MRQKFIDWRPNSKSAALVEYCNDILAEYERQGYILTLRQLYYQLVARDIIPNNVKQYNNLGNMVNNARMAGLIDWQRIEDRVRRPESNSHWNNPKDIISAAADSYYRDHWAGQDRYVELWSEKDAVSNILQPVCRKWDITFMANRGYSSASAMYRASKRFIKAIQEDKEIMNSVIYLKYAHLYNPIENVGRQIKNVKLHCLNGENTSLFDIMNDRPTVIMAGSIT